MYQIYRDMFRKGGSLKNFAYKRILKKETENYSETLRKLFMELYKIEVGRGSYGWSTGLIKGPAKIGNYTSIAQGVRRFCVNHPMDMASTYPMHYNPAWGWVDKDFREKSFIEIGSDVWIGANVLITANCHSIGNGAILAAGAVVTKDVPPYEIWGGLPAKCIRKRFPDCDMGERLNESQWWNLPESFLKTLVLDFKDPKVFLEKVNAYKEGKDKE